MARTPLLRSLRQILRTHAAAEALQISPKEVTERLAQQKAARPSRRSFLLGTAGAASASLFPQIGKAQGERRAPRIAIVGGGIAGLSAALTLADAGVASTVYEASARVGGRMFSNRFGTWDEGQISEWGGELIDTGHTTLLDLAARFSLELDDLPAAEPPSARDVYHFDGRYYPADLADRDFATLYSLIKADYRAAHYPTTYIKSTPFGRLLDDMSIFEWIEWRVPGGHNSPLGQLLDVSYTTEYGGDSTDQSSLNLIYLIADQPVRGRLSLFGVSDEVFHIRGGNQRLPIAIADQLGSSVQTGMRLLSLRRTAAGAHDLTFRSHGQLIEVRADIVLLTLPFPALLNVDLDHAEFDDRKLDTIRSLGRGKNGKLQMQFRSRPWAGSGAWPGVSAGSTYSDTGYQNTWEVTRAQAGTSGILNNYTGGSVTEALRARSAFDTAADALVRADVADFFTRVAPVLPGLATHWNGKATSSIPHKDPLFGLSYSYFRVGQYTRLAGYEGVRQGNVYFAGEHTSRDFQGFMEGGASEGVAAAKKILRKL